MFPRPGGAEGVITNEGGSHVGAPVVPALGGRAPRLGRCEDCGRPLSLGLEGTFCETCEIECPSCGEAECHATCAPELARISDRWERRREVDGRLSTEARRQTQRAVWSLAGARA